MSFKAAASELGVTPTAISHQVGDLEAACGTALFRRRPRPLTLTKAGRHLFPVLQASFDSIATAVSGLREAEERKPLRVTTTNAFAHLWLVPRLPLWRAAHPGQMLEVIGTDAVVDLQAGEAEVAIRYAPEPPAGLMSREILRDTFWPMCSPTLLVPYGATPEASLLRLPLIHMHWEPPEPIAPTWHRWVKEARCIAPALPDPSTMEGLFFREELHAIEAMIYGQGVGICSDVLVARELEAGTLVKASSLCLPGYGFFVAYQEGHPRQAAIELFSEWLSAMTRTLSCRPRRRRR
jgi:LysR family glycine cleavage system transcriptional activator